MKKRIIILTIIFSIFISLNNVFAFNVPELNSPNYGVYNVDTMEEICGQNTQSKISIASITKVMTAIVAIENIPDINTKNIIDYSILNGKVDIDLVVAGIRDGEELSYYDLISTMLVPSGADSAIYLSNIVFGDDQKFIDEMNKKAKEIGMNSTHFTNVTGLDAEDHYSTIEDVAKMMKYAISNDKLKEIMSLESYTTTDGLITVTNTINRSAQRANMDINHILGGKTGTTGDAGLCLASFSDDDGVGLISVVTGTSMYSSMPYNIIDTENLYSAIINEYSLKNIVSNSDVLKSIPVACSKQKSVDIHAKQDSLYYVDNVDESKIAIEYEGMESLDYTIKQGENIGKITIKYNGKVIDSYDVELEERLEFSLIEWIKLNKEGVILLAVILVFITCMICWFSLKKSKSITSKKDNKNYEYHKKIK